MINILELAKISGNTYGPNLIKYKYGLVVKPTHTQRIPALLQKNSKHPIIWGLMTDAAPSVKTTNSFFAGLYIKFVRGEAKEAVIAFRGTADWHNDAADLYSWVSDVLGHGFFDQTPIYQTKAKSFFIKAERYLREHFPHLPKPTLTGHSLGGALAQLLVAQSGYPRKTITFNAPGVGHIPGANPNKSAYIQNINSRYGFINKIGKVLGKIDYFNVPNDEQTAKAAFENYHNAQALETKAIFDSFARAQMDTDKLIAEADMVESFHAQHKIANLIHTM